MHKRGRKAFNTVKRAGMFTAEHIYKFMLAGRKAPHTTKKILNDTLSLVADMLNGNENIKSVSKGVEYWNEDNMTMRYMDNHDIVMRRVKAEMEKYRDNQNKPSIGAYMEEHSVIYGRKKIKQEA